MDESRRNHPIWLALVVSLPVLALVPWELCFSEAVDLATAFAPAGSPGHPLGTDNLGRDLLVRIGSAIRNSVLPLWVWVVVAAFLGTGIGMLLCTKNGSGSSVRIFSFFGSIPLFLLVFGASILQERVGLEVFMAPVMFFMVLRFINLLQSLYFRDANLAYWLAGEAAGGSRMRLIWRYGVRSAWALTLINELVFSLAIVVSIEGALSYMGMGVAEPTASFGNMLASHFDEYLRGRFWVLAVIATAFFLTAGWPFAVLILMQKYIWTPLKTSSRLSH